MHINRKFSREKPDFKRGKLIDTDAGLPDDIFSNHNSQFG
jgi:hypothetical protein